MKLLTKEQQESYENAKICYICKEKFENKYLKDKRYRKDRDHCHYTGKYRSAAHSICDLKYSVPKKIPMVFHNGSYYDCHFIIQELAEEFKKQFTFLGENTEKYITFTVPIEKKLEELIKMQKKLQKIHLTCYNLLIAQAHYQIRSIIFLKELIKLNENTDTMIKNICETCRIKYRYCDCFLEYTNFKDDLTEYKCLLCYKNCQRKFDEKLKKPLFNTCKFSNHDNNKFILLLRKGVYRYEYMDDWEKFNETSLPEQEDFYSHLNMEDITDVD